MTARIETSSGENPLSERERAVIGARLFRTGSIAYPGSTLALTMYIVQECQKKRLNPTSLQTALTTDEERLAALTTEANNAHRGNSYIRKVTPELMKDNLVYTFSSAANWMRLLPADITVMLEAYPTYRGRPELEKVYKNAIDLRMAELSAY